MRGQFGQSRDVLIGILLLEEYIELSDDTETRLTKRARTDRPQRARDVSRWIELARSDCH